METFHSYQFYYRLGQIACFMGRELILSKRIGIKNRTTEGELVMKRIGTRLAGGMLAALLCLAMLPVPAQAAGETDLNSAEVKCYYNTYYSNEWHEDLINYSVAYSGEAETLISPFYLGDYYAPTWLIEGTDYTVAYEDNVNAGIATATFTGIGAYTGTRTLKFAITPANISDGRRNLEVYPNYDFPLLYDGTEKDLLDMTVRVNGVTLVRDTDYTVDYDRDHWSDKATAAGLAGSPDEVLRFPVRIAGMGNYTGEWSTWSSSTTRYSCYACEYWTSIMPHVDAEVSFAYGGWRCVLTPDGLMTVTGTDEMPNELQVGYSRTEGNQSVPVPGISEYREQIKKVVFEGSITKIAGGAFRDCTGLKEVVLPDTVVTIGSEAFYSCRCLTSVHTIDADTGEEVDRLPNTLQTLQIRAFAGNNYNLEMHLPDNITTLEGSNSSYDWRVWCTHGSATEQAFKDRGVAFCLEGYEGFYFYWNQLSYQDTTKRLTLYGKYDGVNGNVVIPNFVEYVKSPFNQKDWIRSITIPASVLKFDGCLGLYRLQSVVIEPGCTMPILNGFVNECYNTTVTIPDSITVIEPAYLGGSYDNCDRGAPRSSARTPLRSGGRCGTDGRRTTARAAGIAIASPPTSPDWASSPASGTTDCWRTFTRRRTTRC